MEAAETQLARADKTVLAARIVWMGISGAVVVMGVLGAALQQGVLPKPAAPAQLPLGVLKGVAYALSVAAIPASALIKKMVLRSLPAAQNAASAVAAGVVVLCSVSEIPALLGVVLLFLGAGFGDFCAMWLVSAVLLAYNFPFREQWLAALRREKTPPAIG